LIQKELSREKLSARPLGVWKYIELLPVLNRSNIVSLGEGGTHLHRAERIADRVGLRNLFIKDETTNPTGSFIDRGVTVEISKAKELGYRSATCGTTGNLGASLAAYSAKSGFKCKIFLSKRIDMGKLYQIIACGADIEAAGNFDEAVLKAMESGNRTYLASPSDPFFLEGLKTTGYEICEQIGWRTPKNLIVPMGDGSHLSMIWRGINELVRIGLVGKADVRMIGVQAQGAAPIVRAFLGRDPLVKPLERRRTIAVDIGFRRPLHGNLAMQAITQSKGLAVAVSDSEMLNAAFLLAKTEGIFAEPASASTIAALNKLVASEVIERGEDTICVLTGTGLKDPSSARRIMERRRRAQSLLQEIGDRPIATGITGTKRHILQLLNESESYGYNLQKKLESRFKLHLSLPSIYQHLNELETIRLIERARVRKELGRERYYYSLTEKGKIVLKRSSQVY